MRSESSPDVDSKTDTTTRFDRLGRTRTLGGAALALWRAARLAIVGVGAIGARLALETVMSGAQVWVVDPDVGEIHNLGTQPVRAGVPKVDAVVAACDAVESDRAASFHGDIRHASIRALRACDLIVDATDDAGLAPYLAALSSGLEIPHLRAAVDGTGEGELGRVVVSLGTDVDPCQVCAYDLRAWEWSFP